MKNEKFQIKFYLIFLVVACGFALSQTVHAALALTPMVAGYSSGSGTFSAAAGSFTTAANAASYGSTGVVSVGGKAITMPASMRMAANAGQMALQGMKVTPLGLVGTLAAGFLLDQGIEYLNGEWTKGQTGTGDAGIVGCWSGSYLPTDLCGSLANAKAQASANIREQNGTYNCPAGQVSAYCPAPDGSSLNCTTGDQLHYVCTGYAGGQLVFNIVSPYAFPRSPMTPGDWDALPDPLPVVAPELPYAPYMPQGVPVEAPDFDFVPFTAPLGEPYTKPDNSTAQPMAKVSPNGKGVTVDTYDQPLTSPDGQPVPNPQPQDTPEPAPEQKTDCDKFPNSVGCTDLGTPPEGELMPHSEVPLSFTPFSLPKNATCPAPMSIGAFGQTIPIAYDAACTYSSGLRPIVLAVAYLSAAFIIFGVPRAAQS